MVLWPILGLRNPKFPIKTLYGNSLYNWKKTLFTYFWCFSIYVKSCKSPRTPEIYLIDDKYLFKLLVNYFCQTFVDSGRRLISGSEISKSVLKFYTVKPYIVVNEKIPFFIGWKKTVSFDLYRYLPYKSVIEIFGFLSSKMWQ